MRMSIKPLKDGTTEVDIRVLDDGRACIHWLRECGTGKITVHKHPQLITAPWYDKRELKDTTAKFSVACRPEQDTINSQKRGTTRFVCLSSSDVNAVTCPQCLALEEAKIALANPTSIDEAVMKRHLAAITGA